jgi:hypothetical protein
MEQIGKEIDHANRDVVWIAFNTQDTYFENPAAGYFKPNVAERATRIEIPIPKGVKSSHISHLVNRFICDGYGLEGFSHFPIRQNVAQS